MENRIRELRKARGLSMDKLGELAGTGATTINKLEKGELRLSLHWMHRVAPALGVLPADLLVDADNPDRAELARLKETRPASEAERALLKAYRDSSDDRKEEALRMALLILSDFRRPDAA